jgi:hypothetical protein
MAVYGYFTDRITAVISGAEIRTVKLPYYCAQDYGVIRSIYGRKLAVFSSFTVRKRPVNDAVLIDLGAVDFQCSLSPYKMTIYQGRKVRLPALI